MQPSGKDIREAGAILRLAQDAQEKTPYLRVGPVKPTGDGFMLVCRDRVGEFEIDAREVDNLEEICRGRREINMLPGESESSDV